MMGKVPRGWDGLQLSGPARPAGEKQHPIDQPLPGPNRYLHLEMLIYLLRAGNNESVDVAEINPGGC